MLLVDEVLAVGDEAFQRKCMERIQRFRSEGRTIVLVSHSASQVQELCDRGIVLKNGAVVFDGEVNDAVSALRDVLEGRRVGDTAFHESGKPIEITRIEVLDSRGAVRDVVPAGAPMASDPCAGETSSSDLGHVIQHRHTDRQMVLASNTERLDVALPPLAAGESSIDFTIESANFGPGSISSTQMYGPGIPEDTHVMWQGARFTMEHDDTSIGHRRCIHLGGLSGLAMVSGASIPKVSVIGFRSTIRTDILKRA